MEKKMKELLNSARPGAVATLCLAVILFAAFALTRVTKRAKLPNVTAYILTGILIGPYVLSLIPQAVIDELDFVTDIALAFIAFAWENLSPANPAQERHAGDRHHHF